MKLTCFVVLKRSENCEDIKEFRLFTTKTCRVLLRLVQLQRLILFVYIINRLLHELPVHLIFIHSFRTFPSLVRYAHSFLKCSKCKNRMRAQPIPENFYAL